MAGIVFGMTLKCKKTALLHHSPAKEVPAVVAAVIVITITK